MIKTKLLLSLAFLAFLFLGCRKEKLELLSGNWREINVADIEATHYNLWNFENSVLTISRVSISNPADRIVIITGNYRLRPSVFGMKLQIGNTAIENYNNDWTIIELKGDRFSIKLEITGGILYREFEKIP